MLSSFDALPLELKMLLVGAVTALVFAVWTYCDLKNVARRERVIRSTGLGLFLLAFIASSAHAAPYIHDTVDTATKQMAEQIINSIDVDCRD